MKLIAQNIWKRRELVFALARTSVARGVAALGVLALGVVLARLYGAEGVGVFALAQSLMAGASLFARSGMDVAMVRFAGRDHTDSSVWQFLKGAILKAFAYSLLAAIAILLFRGLIAELFSAPRLDDLLISITLAIPAFTLSFMLAGLMKGIRKPASASLLENGAVSLVASLIILAYVAVQSQSELVHAGWAFCIAAWLVLVQGCAQAWFWLRGTPSKRDYTLDELQEQRGEFYGASRSFFVLSLAKFSQSVLSILVAGLLLDAADVGLFKTAERAAMLIGFVLMVINAVFPSRFSSLFYRGDMGALGRLARLGGAVGLGLALPLLVLCLFVPQWVLGLFGPEFEQADSLLRIIAFAQLVNVATASVDYLLSMTGHEKLIRNITVTCSALGLAFYFVFISYFGVVGAAWAFASTMILQKSVSVYFVWKALGIWTLPFPNFFGLLGIKPYAKPCDC